MKSMRIEQIAKAKGYHVMDDGKCFNRNGKEVGTIRNGYVRVSMRVNNVIKFFAIHRLMAYQKHGEMLYEEGIEVRHLNGVPTDNTTDNVAIGSHSENMMDIPKEVRMRKAIHATSFVKKHDVRAIREYYETHPSYSRTMLKFGISSKGTLHFILNNRKETSITIST